MILIYFYEVKLRIVVFFYYWRRRHEVSTARTRVQTAACGKRWRSVSLSLFETSPSIIIESTQMQSSEICVLESITLAPKARVKGAVFNRIQRIHRSMFMIRKCCVVSAQWAFWVILSVWYWDMNRGGYSFMELRVDKVTGWLYFHYMITQVAYIYVFVMFNKCTCLYFVCFVCFASGRNRP